MTTALVPEDATVVRLDYAPFPRQAVLHATTATDVLFGGAMGPGKTYALCQHWHLLALRTAGRSMVIFRRTYPQLTEQGGLVDTFRSLMAGGALGDWHEQACEARYKNGSVVALRHAKDLAAVWQFKGAQWDAVAIDEAGDWTADERKLLKTRLRTTNPNIRCLFWQTANPVGVGFYDLKAEYVQPVLDGRVQADEVWTPESTPEDPAPMSRCYIPALHTDNLALTQDYYGRLAGLPAKERAALLTGSWDVPSDAEALFQPGVLDACQQEAVGHQGPLPGHRYLHLWDLARKRDWCVGGTLDITTAPYQLVAFERFRFVPWPQVAERMKVRHETYKSDTSTSRTRFDGSGVGDGLGDFLDIPVGEIEGFIFTAQSKTDAVQSLIFASERAAWRAPATSQHPLMRGVTQLWAELALYRWDDKKLIQDCVMMLAMAGRELRQAVAAMKPPKPAEAPGYVLNTRAPVHAHGWMR